MSWRLVLDAILGEHFLMRANMRMNLVGALLLMGSTALAQSSPTQAASSLASSGQNSSLNSQSAPASVPTLQVHHPYYQLRKGDGFQIEMMYSPELNQFVSVQPDGYVTLKEVGSVFVEGETMPELTATLISAYAKILHDPLISITLRDFEKPYFLASGQVSKPGKYELRSSLTVTQAVAIAGGFNDGSKRSQVLIFHPVAGGMYETKLVNIKKLLNDRNLNEDVYLSPGDLIYVPETTLAKVRKYIPNANLGAYYNPVF